MGLEKNVQRTLMQLIKDFKDRAEMEYTYSYANANANTAMTSEHEPHPDESYLDDLNIDEDNESLLDDDEYQFNDKENMNMFNETSFSGHPTDIDVGGGGGFREVRRTPLSPRFQSPMDSNNRKRLQKSNSHRRSTSAGTVTGTGTKKLSPPPQHTNSAFRNVSARKVITLEKENISLNEKNQELSREIEAIRQQENIMRVRCEESEAINRAARLKIESEALMRESEIRDDFSLKVLDLERELHKSQSVAKEAVDAKEQLEGLKDEIDILKHSKIKLEQTEVQMQKLKVKLEKMSDVRKTLENEEKAHNDAVSKCLDLENEIASLGPLRRQLEEYKSRATNAEVRLVDYEDEIKKLRETTDKMSGLNNELKVGTLRQQEESEHLRRTIHQNGVDESDGVGVGVGQGMSELNPALKAELLRLRNENSRLKAFAAKREDDSVQMLEEKADDANRLADRMKEEYLTTKSSLETSQRDFMAALKREQQLEGRISNIEESNRELKNNLQDERVAAQKAKLNATRTLNTVKKELLDNAKREKEQLQLEWKLKLDELKAVSEDRFNLLETKSRSKEDALNETVAQLHKQSIESLQRVKTEFSDQMESLQKDYESKLEEMKSKNEDERTKLITHGKQLIQKKDDEATEKIRSSEQKATDSKNRYDELCDAQKEYEKKVNAKIQAYRQKLALAEATAKECDELQIQARKLERDKSTLQSENDRFRRQLGGRFGSDTGQYEELQINYNDLLAENRILKQRAAIHSPSGSDIANSFNFASSSQPYSVGTSISASSLSQLRAEYEEKIEEINDDKRELVMKNSSLVTEEKKAQKRAWALEIEVRKLENSNTSLKLQVERVSIQETPFQSPVATGKRSSSKLTPSSISSKASRMWKGSKLSRNFMSPKGKKNSDTPNSTEAVLEFTSPEFQKSVKKLQKGEIDGFKDKLTRRLTAKKKKNSPLKSMSLMDMALSGNNNTAAGPMEENERSEF